MIQCFEEGLPGYVQIASKFMKQQDFKNYLSIWSEFWKSCLEEKNWFIYSFLSILIYSH